MHHTPYIQCVAKYCLATFDSKCTFVTCKICIIKSAGKITLRRAGMLYAHSGVYVYCNIPSSV